MGVCYANQACKSGIINTMGVYCFIIESGFGACWGRWERWERWERWGSGPVGVGSKTHPEIQTFGVILKRGSDVIMCDLLAVCWARAMTHHARARVPMGRQAWW